MTADKFDRKFIAKIVIPLVFALISAFGVAKVVTTPEFNRKSIASLEDKQETVLQITAATTATSAAITLLPDDYGTPISNQLANLSMGFAGIYARITLEKYRLTVTGFVCFMILIPLACIILSANSVLKIESLKLARIKLIVFGLAIFLVVPSSVKVSEIVEETYHASDIYEEIDTTKNEIAEDVRNSETEEDLSFLQSIGDAIKGARDTIKNGITGIATKVTQFENKVLEAFAVMLVTCCLIPVLVLAFYVVLLKIMLGINLSQTNIINIVKDRAGMFHNDGAGEIM